ncbi:islet cell autoantigen 1 isoform X1 [Oncorhynchus mykiss]|uniref:Islet cell autoantigen 1 like n=2 Tax=Oncorhynchus mykiss TaxID=8022 RepID=A0A8K9Y8E9_ONCMY|nr:islet cell autoantigen 1 isoform X1 [Oncorhynchus mykiss]XP_036828357.1 islet cell autoantigen 1 isoform X1 [Oncorhynchus mykiss]XP_036828359.1 islet cell autoantigen 1 isoform X1 [Oncorhynchus mykiss]XP_036828360.1 islet cell autoantigen 1 isoform X1 [Oncorhynchus mykiss]XP_036828361.1 islet cell autoantigen 1 isoform X1 [Oncorhynchus mykiss]
MDGFAGDILSGGRALLGEDSSVMARMQKKFWKTKQVLIKATGKKEDEYVVASDADLDAKLELFHSVQTTSTELLKVIEKYQRRITHLSQEENELGMFLRFQAEHDRTKAGNMMDATSKALCASAKQRLVLCPPLHRMEQEVETFRRRAIADTLLTVTRMEKSRTEYRGALLWMKDVSQELDPDTCKHLDKFRKVQSQVRGSKDLFEKLKNDVCQKVDMLGASRCNMLSHSLCTYQITLLQFWERTACVMSGIHESFKGFVPYQFTTLKDLRDPLEQLTDLDLTNRDHNKEKDIQSNSLVSLDEEKPSESASGPFHAADGQSHISESSLCASLDSALCDLSGHLSTASTDDDLLLLACDQPQPGLSSSMQPLAPLHTTAASGGPWGFGGGDLSGSSLLQQGPRVGDKEEEDRETGDMAFLKDLLSPGPMDADEFSREWQGTFGCLEFSDRVPPTPTLVPPPPTGVACPPSQSPSPTGFLPSQLLDHSLSSTGWATPPMFQAPPLQSPVSGQVQSAKGGPKSTANVPKAASRDMSAWFNLFADLDPLSNPDTIGRSDDEILNA